MNEPRKIIVADDDLGQVKAISTRLESVGYEVIPATDGYTALARAVEHKPDLLILDIHMPAGDGFTVQERKDKMLDLASIPVIYITGDKSNEPRLMAEQMGAVALLLKPLQIDDMFEAIERALPKRAA